MGEQDDLCIDEVPRRDPLIQSFAEGRGSCHVRKELGM